VKIKNATNHPILNFRNEDIPESTGSSGNGYSLLLGTQVLAQNGEWPATNAYNYSTMLTRSREAVDSSEHSES
jgi:hypothetical protein